ncbi:hypothetical protein D770_20105 [Flammeovirgaceae bacterium 311]|nr:hypothetical protein D770_20105 [Flammeovirgaceae bacterium 311]
MKKTFLTFVAVAFGMGVAFAQTTPQTEDKPAVNTEEAVTTDKMSNTEAESGLRTIEVEDLPEAVQASLKGDEFKDFTVLAVAEVQSQEGAQSATKYYQAALAQGDATQPSLIVLFNEEGKAVAQKDTSADQQE